MIRDEWPPGRLTWAAAPPDASGDGRPAPELAIVLPVYNEGEAVEPVLRGLSAAVKTPHELVVA